MSDDELRLDDEPTLNLDDESFMIDDDEPTMPIDDDELVVDEATEELDLSDNEVDYHGDEDEIVALPLQPQIAPQSVVVPSAGAFNALLVVSLVAYVGAAAILLWRLSGYLPEGTLPW